MKSAKKLNLPVSPICNIECRYCDNEAGTTKVYSQHPEEVLRPEDVAKETEKALKQNKNLKTAVIDGPGDPLDSNRALRIIKLLRRDFPQLSRKLCTHGLLLYDKADQLIQAGVSEVSVTVNAVYPDIEEKMLKGIRYHNKRYEGKEAADILIRNQIRGIWKISLFGVRVHVRTILVPGVNDRHIPEIAKIIHKAGASSYSIDPLVPEYEMSEYRAPSELELEVARIKADPYIRVKRPDRLHKPAVFINGFIGDGQMMYLQPEGQKRAWG